MKNAGLARASFSQNDGMGGIWLASQTVSSDSVNLTTAPKALQDRLRTAVLTHVQLSSSANSTFQERLDVCGALVIHKQCAVHILAAQVVALSGWADLHKGWDQLGNALVV